MSLQYRPVLAITVLFAAALAGMSACSETTPSTSPVASGPVTQAQVAGIVHVCASCHGFEGRSISPTFPNLAGQQPAYIEAQLKSFRDHKRGDPHAQTYMWGMAGSLSDDMIHGIAAFFSAEKPAPGETGNPAEMQAGKNIFEHGIAARHVPACQGCHGNHAQGMAVIPQLAGQHRDYIEKQLGYFASNARKNRIMHENSKNLTADEIRDVATYVAAQ